VKTYRVMAFLVGVLLAFCTLMAIFKYLHSWVSGIGTLTGPLGLGGSLQQFGADMSFMWAAHGYAFIVYVVVAFLTARKAGWSFAFLILALVAGLIPGLIFWVEHRVMLKLRAENPELTDAEASTA